MPRQTLPPNAIEGAQEANSMQRMQGMTGLENVPAPTMMPQEQQGETLPDNDAIYSELQDIQNAQAMGIDPVEMLNNQKMMRDNFTEEEAQRAVAERGPEAQEQAMKLAMALENPLEYLKSLSVEKSEEVSLENLSEKEKDKILKAYTKCRDIANDYYEDTIEPEILRRREIYYATEESYKEKYPQLSEMCSWVSRDIKTACDWLLPAFMEVFTGSDDPVSVKGVNIEDDGAAEKIQQLIRYQLEKKNDFQQWVYAEINDALRDNFGVAKIWWKHEEKRTPMEIMLDNKDASGVAAFLASMNSGKIEVKSMEVIPEAPDFMKVVYEDIKVTSNYPVLEYLPSSELRFTPDATKLQECRYVAHRKVVRGDYLKRKEREGIFKNIDKALKDYGAGNTEPTVLDRHNDFERTDKTNRIYDNDLASKEVELYEAYLDVDYNNDGIFEHLIVHAVGDHLLRVVENDFEEIPFFICSTLKDANKIFSDESMATNFEQIQDLKTAIIRQIIVNISKNNAPRMFVNEQKVDMDALINGEEIIGIQGNPQESVFAATSLPLSSISMEIVNYAQTEMESQSGSTRYNQGLDSNSLNKTATGITAIMGASEKRNKLLARSLAESFFIPIFKFLIKLNQMFLEDEQMIRLTNESVTIKKEELDIDYDLIINVGQGAGTKEAQIQYYMYMLNTIYPILAQQNIVNASSWYNLVKKVLEAMGIRDVTPFLVNPDTPEAKQAIQQAQQQAIEAQAQQMQQAVQLAIAKSSVPRVSVNLSDLPYDAQQQYLQQAFNIETTEQNIEEHDIINQ